ncbi:MAG: hypothetical protein I8H76_07165 [Burkholderiales bacterium]|nr:hypothetical protein [Burkholderiales bacterium]MBH2015765.1 hypothetical protein [Burkholderiales bacterium]
MAEQQIAKAQLIELDESLKNEADNAKKVTVQFNPDSLKLAFANQIQNSNPSTTGSGGAGSGAGGSGDQASGTSGRQFVGAGTTKLSVQLWFDANATADGQNVDDVRRLTQDVIYFITPKKSKQDETRFVPPGVRFSWGSFLFDGLIDGIEETIEFFSPQGKPLRASISLSLSQQTILVANFGDSARPAGTPRGPGANPLSAASAGGTLQAMASASGRDWQSIAAANGIDNPRQLEAGQLIDLRAPVPRSLF